MQKVTLKAVEENTNGKEITFKKNVDFFELKEGTFYTIDALMRKYDSADSTIYKKARDFSIPMEKIAGLTCFRDDLRFEKENRGGRIENLKGKQITTYTELHRAIEQAIGEMFASRTEASANLKIQYQAINAHMQSQNDWNANLSGSLQQTIEVVNKLALLVTKATDTLEHLRDAYPLNMKTMRDEIATFSANARENNKLLNEILNHLTKGGK